VIDHLEKMRARKAAHDYMTGVSIRQQADELSKKRLPANGLTYEDGKLIRDCYAEHERLSRLAEPLTMQALSRHYGIPVAAISVELDLKGFVNPMRKAADRVVPA